MSRSDFLSSTPREIYRVLFYYDQEREMQNRIQWQHTSTIAFYAQLAVMIKKQVPYKKIDPFHGIDEARKKAEQEFMLREKARRLGIDWDHIPDDEKETAMEMIKRFS